MAQAMQLGARLPEGLRVHISHVQLKSGFPDWNRAEVAPSFHRLYYITEGEGSVVINGVTYYPKPNQLMIMPAGTSQTTYTSKENPYTRYFCHFDAQVGEWPLFHADSKLYISDVGDPEFIRSTFNEMIGQFQAGGPFAALRMQAGLLYMLACCLEEGDTPTIGSISCTIRKGTSWAACCSTFMTIFVNRWRSKSWPRSSICIRTTLSLILKKRWAAHRCITSSASVWRKPDACFHLRTRP